MIYCFGRRNARDNNPQRPRKTRQPPVYVPYVVDNLWEWRRPDEFPSRRYATYATPSVDMAAESGGGDDGCVYEIELNGEAVIAQVNVAEGRLHRDCKNLRRLIHVLLDPEWFDLNAKSKFELGRIFLPCLSKEEIESVISEGKLAGDREEIWDAITFWEDVSLVKVGDEPPHRRGEIFFYADEWMLEPLL